MSVAEFPRPQADPTRLPPQDIAAEQGVLGAMLLSKDAIAEVIEELKTHDFYKTQHQTLFETVLDLYGRGEPADAVTVAAELTRLGELNRIGGPAYIHTLVASVPTAANAAYYARIVREKAILRRLVEAGTRIVNMSYDEQGEVDDLVDRAQVEVYEVTDRRTSDDYQRLQDLLNNALSEIEAIANHDGALIGVPTGFNELD